MTESDDAEAAEKGIALTADFFERMGCPVHTSSMVQVNIEDVVAHLEAAKQLPLGEGQDIGADEVRAILKEAA